MKRIALSFAVLFPAVFFAGCAATHALNENHRSVSAKTGDTVEIALNGNATTGYRWEFQAADKSCFAGIRQSYKTDARPGICGAPGVFLWRAKAVKPGKTSVFCRYYRPWEKFRPGTDQEILFNIEINP